LQTDIAQERFTLEGAMRQVAAEATRKPRTETRTAPRSATAPADTPGSAAQVASGLPRQDGTTPPPTDLPAADWHAELLLSARERLLRGRPSLKKQRVKEAEAPQTAVPRATHTDPARRSTLRSQKPQQHPTEPQLDSEDLNSVNYDTRQETDLEPASTPHKSEPHLDPRDSNSVDYDAWQELDFEPAYEPEDEPPVVAPPVRHAPRRAAPPVRHASRRVAPEEERERRRLPLSFGGLARLTVVLIILAGVVATISWQWSAITGFYQFFNHIGQKPQSTFAAKPGKPEFRPRVSQEQASGHAAVAALGGLAPPAVASLPAAQPSNARTHALLQVC
jgi:hypothetical protein